MDQLHRSGMLDEQEHASFAEIVEKLLRRLSRRGAVWHVPRPRQVWHCAGQISQLCCWASATRPLQLTRMTQLKAACAQCRSTQQHFDGQSMCLQVLKQVPFLQGLPRNVFEQVCLQSKLLRFAPGASPCLTALLEAQPGLARWLIATAVSDRAAARHLPP